jgi:predicted branched-subunit amino acid permease
MIDSAELWLVIAGAAQLTALQLLVDQAPTVIVIISALAVNLRMAMYSASLTPWLGPAPLWQRALAAYFLVDQSYGLSVLRYEQNRHWTIRQRIAYFFGTVAPICPLWYVFTLVGALVPESFALDFAVPITFLALITPMVRSRAHVAAALVSITVALLLAFLPYNLGLLVAGIAAMITGAEVERRTAQRGAA